MAQRSDGRRNRAGLVRAAEAVFAEQGVGVPLGVIAERAGVGRGTLYRHFADRYALAAAVYEQRLADFEALAEASAGDPDAAEIVLRAITSRQPSARGLTPLLAGAPQGRRELAALSTRTHRLLAGPLATSQVAGRLAADVGVEDLVLVVAMVEGIIAASPDDEVDDAVARGVDLVLRGLRPGSG